MNKGGDIMGRPKLRNFYIGEIIDDMCIDNIIHDNKIGDILQCNRRILLLNSILYLV